MEIKDTYIRRYWEKIVADQLADELLGKGYQVDREKKVDEIIEVISEIILNYLSENTEEKITIKR